MEKRLVSYEVESLVKPAFAALFMSSKALTLAVASFINRNPRHATGAMFHLIKNAIIPAYIFYTSGHKLARKGA